MRFSRVFFAILIFITFPRLNGQVKDPVLSGEERVSLFTKQAEMKGSSPFKDLKWQYVGPTPVFS